MLILIVLATITGAAVGIAGSAFIHKIDKNECPKKHWAFCTITGQLAGLGAFLGFVGGGFVVLLLLRR